jgi:hypothetical protein
MLRFLGFSYCCKPRERDNERDREREKERGVAGG